MTNRFVHLGTFPGHALSRAQQHDPVFPLWQLPLLIAAVFGPIIYGIACL